MKFEPVAIIGQSCLLPGAHTPDELWQIVTQGRVVIGPAPATRWRADRDRMLAAEHCFTDRGGFVEGFERIWNPGDYPLDAELLADLDPLFQWLLHTGRAALIDAGIEPGRAPRTGAIVGNLGYPTDALIDLAQAVYVPEAPGRKRNRLNRFSTGYPVHLMCSVLGLEAGGFAIDAACASSLYAIRLACEWLQTGRADCMLAGGVNRCDSLLIHSGFTALRALSPTGQSRPFHRDADGLVPAEGCALVALKRLADAEAAGDRILGVIRGVGLSNDGRASGILTPAEVGQVQAMRSAYEQCGLAPRDISYVECHATGTQVGDAVELRSMSEVFAAARGIAIGSLKANLGHLITASGAGGLMKVLAALRHGQLPAGVNATPLTTALDNTPFHLLREPSPWVTSSGPRRAAISSFGFGGNNAHLILEEYIPKHLDKASYTSAPEWTPDGIAVVSMAVRAGDGNGTSDFATDLLFGGRTVGESARFVRLPSAGLAFPPRDLARTLAQQSLFLSVTREAIASLKSPPGQRTSILVGIQCDAEAARPTLRLALADLIGCANRNLPAREASLDDPLDAARVIGCMPNIVANRVNRQYAFSAPGFSVMAEEISGVRALEIAIGWLEAGDIDTAIVGAVDLAAEPIHRGAVDERPGDAAVVLILKREKDARAAGDPVVALLESNGGGSLQPSIGERIIDVFGKAHAAAGLLNIAGTIAALQHSALPLRCPFLPGEERHRICVPVEAMAGQSSNITVVEPQNRDAARISSDAPDIHLFRADNHPALIEALKQKARRDHGRMRLAIVAAPVEFGAKVEQAVRFLQSGLAGCPPDGIFFRPEPIAGELAFVYTGAAAAYRGMGRDLLLEFPQLADRLSARCVNIDRYARWVYHDSSIAPSDFEQLCGSSFLCQIHSEFSRRVLKLSPDRVIGLSSGETNSLFAFGAWHGMGEFLEEIWDSGIYTRQTKPWTHYRISATRGELDAALRDETAACLTIINSASDFVIGGEPEACQRVVSRLVQGHTAPLSMELAVHCAALQPIAALWHRLHHRSTVQPPGIRFYSNATGNAYPLTSDSIADALTAQALHTVDFPATIRQAWNDGARIFVEHGPRNQCTQSIRAILGDLPHLALPLDVAGRSSLLQSYYAAAELWTAGVNVDIAALRREPESKTEQPADLVYSAHPPSSVSSPDAGAAPYVLEPAPKLAPLLDPEPHPSTRQPATVATAVAIHAQISARHRAYVEEMTRLQQAFLATEQHLLSALNGVTPAAPPMDPLKRAFSRQDLERLASGRISDIFGPAFAAQDAYRRQVRMPEPPMLLADRVVELDGEPNSMGLGRIVTETDVLQNSWYVHQGYMPAGIAIESGQADLLLISWLGADRLNKGDRVYRLLGCDLTFHGSLPKAGDTLRYEIHVDGHAQSGGIRMFFFHYDCTSAGKPRLTVRDGQAGFFTDEELADSEGVLWSPGLGDSDPRQSATRTFNAEQVQAFAEGRLTDCFGPDFAWSEVHTRSPRIPGGRLQMFQRVTGFDPSAGYLRAEWSFSPADWFFEGHFRGDPCMPGTLMFEGCLQSMAFYMSALGLTLERDGWRFEPVPEQVYQLRCRGQATPSSKLLVYELFVTEVVRGSEPALFADVLCTIDGLKAFHCRRLGLRLVPDWPLEEQRAELIARPEPKPVAVVNGFAYGYFSLLACALGRATDAFGPAFARFDGPIRTPRLPAPPYHFISRVTRAVQGSQGPIGSECEVEYDIPADAWYFSENGSPVIPPCVLLEALLQPCGWLASFAGSWLGIRDDIFFRNLDGSGRILGEITPASGVLSTRLKLTSFAELAGMTIYAFDIVSRTGDSPVFEGSAVFGNFPAAALEQQAGLPPAADEAEWLVRPCEEDIDLATLPDTPRFPSGRIRMFDRITGYWPTGGAAGLGVLRAEKDLDPRQWFFKAHFFNDPVQPGSLGIEAMVQALQVCMIRKGLDAGIPNPRFESLATGEPVSWMYRGQVTPKNRGIAVLLELLEIAPGYARATASLWVDGKKIYAIPSFAMRVVPGDPEEEILDPDRDVWLRDHCPTYTVPALPMMSVVDRLASAAQRKAPHQRVVELQDVVLTSWISFAWGTRRLKVETSGRAPGTVDAALLVWRHSDKPGLSRFDPVATGRVLLAETYPEPPAPFAPLVNAEAIQIPYESGDLFHGPRFRIMQSLHRSAADSRPGATILLDAAATDAPRGLLHQILLDGATHGIPNADLHLWSPRISDNVVGYPVRVSRLSLCGPTPIAGIIRCEVRFSGFDADEISPVFDVQWIASERVWASARLVYALLPKGPIGMAPGSIRRAYLKDRTWFPSLEIGTFQDGATTLTSADIAQVDWLPGTLRHVFQASAPIRIEEIAVKQHIARELKVHPGEIAVSLDHTSATCPRYPLNVFPVLVNRAGDRTGERVSVHNASPPQLRTESLRLFWQNLAGVHDWPVADLYFALIERFVRRVELRDPQAFQTLNGRPALFLANHQVAVESLLFNVIVSALCSVPVKTIAKVEHRETWIGQLILLTQRYPGVRLAPPILFFDRDDPASLLSLLQRFHDESRHTQASLMAHVAGTRARSCRERITRMSSVFADLATKLGLPIIPVRFVGGLPVDPVPERLDFPLNWGRQDIVFGKPIHPDELLELPLCERSLHIHDAIEQLQPPAEQPFAPAHGELSAQPEAKAVLFETLQSARYQGALTRRLLESRWTADPTGDWLRAFREWLDPVFVQQSV